jgi:hypothetical protein
MKTIFLALAILLAAIAPAGAADTAEPTVDTLARGFDHPPRSARLMAYWWWLNGNVTRESITRDLEEMKAKGFGGAILCDAGGATQDGNAGVPAGPCFGSPDWIQLYRHTLREATRLKLDISLSIQSGWNLGGPTVTPEEASKLSTWSQTNVSGPATIDIQLAAPPQKLGFYRDVAVLAYPASQTKLSPIKMLSLKTAASEFAWSAPDCSPLLEDIEDDHANFQHSQVLDITTCLSPTGRLTWKAPAGEWEILRFGYTASGAKVSTSSDTWNGLAIDYLDPDAFDSYWNQVVLPLIQVATEEERESLAYLHTDSWELGGANWSRNFPAEFRQRRGYDPLPYLPVLAGRIIDSRKVSNRFLFDLRKTVGDCIADNHYRRMRQNAHALNIGIHPESGGPHGAPIDSIRNMGISDIPMSEFWARSWRHRVNDTDRFFVKQPASAAHIYGHTLVAAEGFTTIGPHWQETPWDNLKPSFDRAACEGLNRLVWHAFTCSPKEMGVPGQEYFAGTHFNPNATWWDKSGPFLSYINRCQYLLQQGLFVADACYYYGDNVPSFAQLKRSDPAGVLPGFDYDVMTEDALLNRLTVKNGRLLLPDGMSYRVLVLPNRKAISLPALKKIRELVHGGATVIGPKPAEATGLTEYPRSDKQAQKIANELWGTPGSPAKTGTGRVIVNKTARQVLTGDGVAPDFEYSGGTSNTTLDYIHRQTNGLDIYFVANRSNTFETVTAAFRVYDRAPELWDPVTGEKRVLTDWSVPAQQSRVPLELPPYGSLFIVFRKPASAPTSGSPNFPRFNPVYDISGEWSVTFDPKWGGPGRVTFKDLTDWTQRSEEGIRYYSGTAVYEKTIDIPEEYVASQSRLMIDLGEVNNLAEVRVNGMSAGIAWAVPFRVEVTGLLKRGRNTLQIEVVNFWPNRVIGDQRLPEEKRLTKTNIRKLTADTPLTRSGLLGPVRLLKTP